MKDKIIQISVTYRWTGNWEDSQPLVYGLGESGKTYYLNEKYNESASEWVEMCDSPEVTNQK